MQRAARVIAVFCGEAATEEGVLATLGVHDAVEVPFDLPPGESPAGVELRIGPDAPEAILPHYDALALRPAAGGARRSGKDDGPGDDPRGPHP